MFIKSETDCFHLERSFNDLSLCVSSFSSHIFSGFGKCQYLGNGSSDDRDGQQLKAKQSVCKDGAAIINAENDFLSPPCVHQ